MTVPRAAQIVAEGNAFFREGRFLEAADRYEAALAKEPELAEARFNLGCALDRGGRTLEAVPHFQEAVRLRPGWPEAHFNLGSVLGRLGRTGEALPHLQGAARLKPHDAGVRNNLGLALSEVGKGEEAEAAFFEALRLDPGYAQAYSNLSLLYERFGRTSEAISAAENALRLRPEFPEALNNLGNALKAQGRAAEALPYYREALRLHPRFNEAHSSLLFALNYPAGMPGEEIAAAHRGFGASLSVAAKPHANDPDPQRVIRVGYLSGDFRDHAVSRFLEGVLKEHDRSRFHIFCYSNVATPDGRTACLARFADHWRDIAHLSDEETERTIREDRIDLLVDLSGHTAGNRLTLFARKPAPVQLTWLGYPNSTGLDAIDYRITDAISDPPGLTEHLHSEELLRLPVVFTCFAPPAEAPAVAPLPALAQGGVTFGSFNNPAKLTPETVALWCAVLRGIPSARMLVKGYSLADPGTRERLAALFEKEGVSPARLVLRGNTSSYAEHLDLYRTVDIALDSYPYNGTTTTCEALWMGVPVVTLAGGEHRSRVGKSLLAAVGLPELAAGTPQQFQGAALSLAADPGRLAQLRGSLRQKMAASPLTDAPAFTRNLEEAFRLIWRKWCGARMVAAPPKACGGIPDDPVTLGETFLAGGAPDQALRAFLAALDQPPARGAGQPDRSAPPLSGMQKCFDYIRDKALLAELNRDILAVGASPLPPLAGEIGDDTLQLAAEALLRRGFVTAADLVCRHLLERGHRTAGLFRLLGDVAREVGEDGQAADQYQRCVQTGERGTGTAIALLKARESARLKEGVRRRHGYLLIKSWGYGFWSDMGHVLGGLLLAEITGRTPVVHWGGRSLFTDDPAGNAFETFFEPVTETTLEGLARGASSFFPQKWHAANLLEEGVNVWDGPGSRLSALRLLERTEEVVVSDFHFPVHDLVPWIRAGHWLHGRDADAVSRALFGRYLRVRPAILAEVEEFHRRRMSGSTLLAVHARGGDKGGEDPNLERLNRLYPPYIERFLQAHPAGRIFLITDDDTLLERFCRAYGDLVIHGDAVRTGNGQGVHYRQGEGRYRLGKEVLSDVLLALRCHAFLGNGLSNVSCAVAQLKEWRPGSCTLLGARLDRMRPFTMYRS